MKTHYYTAKTGTRNANGHTWTRGKIYIVAGGRLEYAAPYRHQSGAGSLEQTLSDTVFDNSAFFPADMATALHFVRIG